MKKLQILVLVLTLSSTSLFASTDPKPETPADLLRKEIIELLGTPKIIIEEDMLQNDIQFTVTAQGSIVVLQVDSENVLIKDYIKTKLNYKKTKLKLVLIAFSTFRIKSKNPSFSKFI